MRVALDYVLARVDAEKLDRMTAHQRGAGGAAAGKIAYAEGTEAIREILQTLPGQVSGDIVLRCWRHGDNRGKKALAETAYTWTVAGTMEGGAIGGAPGVAAGPSWREYLDLKLDLARREIEDRYRDKEKGDGFSMRDLAPIIAGLAQRLAAPVSGAPDPAPVSGPAPTPKAKAGERDPELDAILADVVRFYRRNPEQARQFAPMLRDMANNQPSGDA